MSVDAPETPSPIHPADTEALAGLPPPPSVDSTPPGPFFVYTPGVETYIQGVPDASKPFHDPNLTEVTTTPEEYEATLAKERQRLEVGVADGIDVAFAKNPVRRPTPEAEEITTFIDFKSGYAQIDVHKITDQAGNRTVYMSFRSEWGHPNIWRYTDTPDERGHRFLPLERDASGNLVPQAPYTARNGMVSDPASDRDVLRHGSVWPYNLQSGSPEKPSPFALKKRQALGWLATRFDTNK